MKSYEFVKTDDKDLFRVVDRNGDWTHYYYKPNEQYLRAANFILDVGYNKGIGFVKYLKSKSEEEIERKLKLAGDRGDAIHQFIAKILSEEKVDRATKILAEDNTNERMLTNDEWVAILSFQSFWNAHQPKLIAHEMAIYNLGKGYAGTLDAVIRLTKKCDVKTCRCDKFVGKIGLFDWKSGGGIWDSYGAQIAAYGVSNSITRLLGLQKLDYTAILRVGTRHKTTGGYEFQPYSKSESSTHYKEFLAAIQICDASYKPFDPKKEIYDIPEVLNIKVVKEIINQKPRAKARVSKKNDKNNQKNQHKRR